VIAIFEPINVLRARGDVNFRPLNILWVETGGCHWCWSQRGEDSKGFEAPLGRGLSVVSLLLLTEEGR
jgi:hypothetical protein